MAIGKKFMKSEKNPKLIELYKFLFNNVNYKQENKNALSYEKFLAILEYFKHKNIIIYTIITIQQ